MWETSKSVVLLESWIEGSLLTFYKKMFQNRHVSIKMHTKVTEFFLTK